MFLICKTRVFKTIDNRLVPETDRAAAFLVAGVGKRVADKDLLKEFDQDEIDEFFIDEREYVPPPPATPPEGNPLVSIARADSSGNTVKPVNLSGGGNSTAGASTGTAAPATTMAATASVNSTAGGTSTKVNPEADKPSKPLP